MSSARWLVTTALLGCNGILGIDPVTLAAGGSGGGGSGGTGGATGGTGGAVCGPGTDAVAPVYVSVGDGFACAVSGELMDGRLFCWGSDASGQIGHATDGMVGDEPCEMGSALQETPFFDRTPYRVAAGKDFACARVESTVGEHEARCWGAPGPWLGASTLAGSVPLTGFSVERILAGDAFACAVSNGLQVRCWGKNDHLQLGTTGGSIGTLSEVMSLGNVPLGNADYRVVELATGKDFACAAIRLGPTGVEPVQFHCWGSDASGQASGSGAPGGDVAGPSSSPAITFFGLSQFPAPRALAAGDAHACLVTGDGHVLCWGDNASHQSGTNGPSLMIPHEVWGGPVTSHALSVAAGRAHACAVFQNPNGAERKVRCWGANDVGQLGNGTNAMTDFTLDQGVPKEAQLPAGFVPERVAARGDVSCAISAGDGQMAGQQVLCWGGGQFGALGQGSVQNVGDQDGELAALPPIAIPW